MTIMDTIRARHSVREYLDRPLEGEALAGLERAVAEAREASGLNVQLVRDNPEVFKIFLAHYGIIRGARASIVFAARGDERDEAIGYWGERIVLAAQELGLNTCWQALASFKKSKAQVEADEAVRMVIAVGYGATQGKPRKTKPVEALCAVEGDRTMPAWFAPAMEAAQLAPTAMNNQRFRITLRADGRTVAAEAPEGGWNIVDLGIVKCHFELAASEAGADWAWE